MHSTRAPRAPVYVGADASVTTPAAPAPASADAGGSWRASPGKFFVTIGAGLLIGYVVGRYESAEIRRHGG